MTTLTMITVPALAASLLLASGNVSATPTDAIATSSAAEPAQLYWQGHAALGSGDWRLALQRFKNLENLLRRSEPSVADAAIYWQAYALARAERGDETAAAVARLRREFPNSHWNDAARLLRRDDAAVGNAVGSGAHDEALLATLMSLPPAQAIPGLVAVLQGQHPPQQKTRALFVLSQIDDPGAVAQVVAVARGRDRALRAEAVRLLGVIGATDEFREVYAAARDAAGKRQVLNAMGVAGADAALADVARNDSNVELRVDALRALGVSGNTEVLAEVARSDTDSRTRREAIRALGVANGTRPLLALYPQVIGTPALRDEVLKSLLVAADEKVLLVLHRRARTVEEKQAIRRVLQEAGHDPGTGSPAQSTPADGSRK
ncbi:MAG: hypothetical protein ACREPV_00655 [Lysobacter sp.]